MVDPDLAYEDELGCAALAVDNIGAEAREENACGARRLVNTLREAVGPKSGNRYTGVMPTGAAGPASRHSRQLLAMPLKCGRHRSRARGSRARLAAPFRDNTLTVSSITRVRPALLC